MKEIVRYKNCFVCGHDNPHGLKARFFEHDGGAVTELTAEPHFEGYQGLYHGGILASLLDEVMIKAVLSRGVFAVTAEMTVRFKKPIPTGTKLRLTGKITGAKKRVYTTTGEALGPDGTIFATATGTYIQAREELKDQLVRSIDS